MAAVQEIFGEDQPQDDGLPEEFKTMSAEDIQRRWAWEKMVFVVDRGRCGVHAWA